MCSTLATTASISAIPAEMATVRIFLPTHRRPTMLPRALASLCAQTCRDWVCELHNDAPDDLLPGQLLAELDDPRFTLITHPQNLGGTASFNLFFQPCPEPFYSILEDDNWWEPEFLATMLETAAAHPTVTVFWANMRFAREEPDGSFTDTGRTIWPEATGAAVQFFPWGRPQQICGALHSNGAALFRSQLGQDFQIPAVPFAVIEPFRERAFPHPLALVSKPLATFSLTRQTTRSHDVAEWAETQAILAATFFKDCPWSKQQWRLVWADARACQPPETTNLILAAIAEPACRDLLRYAQCRDWWIAIRGLVRRPSLYFRLRRSRRVHTAWWQFLEKNAGQRWREAGGSC